MKIFKSPVFYLFILLIASILIHIPTMHIPLYMSDAWRQTDQESVVWHFVYQDYNIFHPQFFYDGAQNIYVQLELQVIPFLTATLMKLFGWHAFLLHVVPSAIFTLNVWLLYLVGKKFGSPWIGLLSAIVYMLIPYDVYYGQALMPEILMLCSTLLALLAVESWTKSPTWKNTILVALSITFVLLAKLPGITIALGLLYLIVKRRGWKSLFSLKAIVCYIFSLGINYLYIKYEGSIAVSRFISGDTNAYFTSHLSQNFEISKYAHSLQTVGHNVLGPAIFFMMIVAIVWFLIERSELNELHTIAVFWIFGAFLFTSWVATNNALSYYYMVWDIPASILCGLVLYRLFCRTALTPIYPLLAIVFLGYMALYAHDKISTIYSPYNKPYYNLSQSLNIGANDKITFIGTNPTIFDYTKHYGWRYYWEDEVSKFEPWIENKIKSGATILIINNKKTYPNITKYLNKAYHSYQIQDFTIYKLK